MGYIFAPNYKDKKHRNIPRPVFIFIEINHLEFVFSNYLSLFHTDKLWQVI